MLTALEKLEMRLRRLGYVILYLRQPIPSENAPGIVAYCEKEALSPDSGKPRTFEIATVDTR